MTYEYKSHIYLAEAVLNVKNLASQTAFYQKIIGLEILSQTETEVVLGLGGKALVHLIQAEESSEVRGHYGLYHLAILLPTRKALADALKHLTDLQIPLVGGADHGYSEALYLEDLEGNGIELYRDKPVSTWDIREDGRIIGVTEALAAQDIYELGERVEPFILAEGTRMGHIHLSVKDSRKSSQFYQKVLGLEDKFSVPNASWIAAGDYHHHLAVNEWGGKGLAPRKQGLPGLAYSVIEVARKEELLMIAQRAQEVEAPIKWLTSSQLEITDPDGIVTRIRLDRI
ncbi:glyoxalase/Bleomycin resistance /Dioxygenase superfamily protein [Streptococcus mitis]|uniref:Glyoxalase/Bleomycin resistance /Dioxygenase superfamily protein n=1 Tax=Streptococcus mitis TaxID=28037 RepID=A0A081SB70_STRMT|nr:VOC family protein [Streptococcus mitis]KER08173.1 glyoxalase/Bleomycin resistance /Dioxygenase superfamily protein [Streptococcus mitis]